MKYISRMNDTFEGVGKGWCENKADDFTNIIRDVNVNIKMYFYISMLAFTH